MGQLDSESARAARELVRAAVARHLELPAGDDDELDLSSFVVIALAEELETLGGFVVTARELLPENFSTVAKLTAFVERKRA